MKLIALVAAGLALSSAALAAEPFDPFSQARIEDRPDARAPMATAFLDETGKPTTLAALAGGKPLVVAFVQHRCPNLCGVSLQGLAQSANQQADHHFALTALSIDPRETPSDAQVSLGHLVGDGAASTHALTGAAPAIAAVANALGYHYAWDPRFSQYAHIAAAAVLSPEGKLAGWVYGVTPPPQVLHTALAAATRGGFAGIGEKLLLLCYHYDPDKGRYDPLAWTMLRWGSGAAIVALAALIGGLALKGRRP